jgi:methionyl aminopeptidase
VALFAERRVEIKTPEQLCSMRRAGLVVCATLELVRQRLRPGMTTAELDALANEHIQASDAVPSFLGYHGFPGSLCVSVNDEVVHGIPGPRLLADGDVVSVDCGAVVDGWHGDAAMTVALGDVSPGVEALLRVTDDALWQGIGAVRPGGRVSDVSAAVESYVASRGLPLGIVEDYVGHGIGSLMHQPPPVPNRGRSGRGPQLVSGIALAIEPMLVLGDPETAVLDDDWTVVTSDGSVAAHFEHTVALTERGAWVLTAHDGGRERLASMGLPYGGPD